MKNDYDEKNDNESALGINISALGNNPLRAIQQCETANEAWKKLERWHAGKTVMNRLGCLSTLFIMKYDKGK